MTLSEMEKQNLKSFLIDIYGPQVNSWPMNTRIFDLTFELLEQSGECSDLMDLVPRPLPPGKSASKWIKKQVREALLRKLKKRKKHYVACVNTAAWKMKTEFNMAAQGL